MSDIYEREGALLMNLKKCASTSVRQGFKGKVVHSDGITHQDWKEVKVGCAGCFVRDPATRLVSVWKNLVQVVNPRDFYQPLGKHMGLEFNDPFDVYIDKVLATPMEQRDHHVRSQYDQLAECRAMLGYEVPWYVGTFENIWADWQRYRKFVQKWSSLQLPKDLPHTNRGKVATHSELEYESIYRHWRDRVYDDYADDYELWEGAVRDNG